MPDLFFLPAPWSLSNLTYLGRLTDVLDVFVVMDEAMSLCHPYMHRICAICMCHVHVCLGGCKQGGGGGGGGCPILGNQGKLVMLILMLPKDMENGKTSSIDDTWYRLSPPYPFNLFL